MTYIIYRYEAPSGGRRAEAARSCIDRSEQMKKVTQGVLGEKQFLDECKSFISFSEKIGDTWTLKTFSNLNYLFKKSKIIIQNLNNPVTENGRPQKDDKKEKETIFFHLEYYVVFNISYSVPCLYLVPTWPSKYANFMFSLYKK